MNVDKTETIAVSSEQKGDVIVEIGGNQIRNVNEAKYLGTFFLSQENNKEEINDRIMQCTKIGACTYPSKRRK